jgi:hypothetical protein
MVGSPVNNGSKCTITATFNYDYSRSTGRPVTITVTWTASIASDNSIVTSVNPSDFMSQINNHTL